MIKRILCALVFFNTVLLAGGYIPSYDGTGVDDLFVSSITATGQIKVSTIAFADGTVLTSSANLLSTAGKAADSDLLDGLDSTVFFTTGVAKITAGTNITITPTDGKGDVTINSTGGGNGITYYNAGMIWRGELFVTDELVMTAENPYAITLGTVTARIDPDGDKPIGAAAVFTVEASTSNGTNQLPWFDIMSSFEITAGSTRVTANVFTTTDFPAWTIFRVNCDQVGSTTAGGGGGYVAFNIMGKKQ